MPATLSRGDLVELATRVAAILLQRRIAHYTLPPSEVPLTTGQVGKLCKVASRTVTKWIDSGKLVGYRIPGSNDRRVPAANLVAFLRRSGMPVPPCLLPGVVCDFGLRAGEVIEGSHSSVCPVAFGVFLNSAAIRAAVVGDSEGLCVAAGAVRALREKHPHAVIVAVVSEDAPESWDANGLATVVVRRPVDFAEIARLVEGGRP